MPRYICKTCGVQRAKSPSPPPACPICDDARQAIPAAWQGWITPDRLVADHGTVFRQVAPGITSLRTEPKIGIGQRVFLLQTEAGNVLWDCLTLLDDATVSLIKGLGGLAAIAISHPHFHAAMARWGQVFDCPVLIHARDREWVAAADPCLEFWEGETREALPGIDLHRFGGHFPGSTVLHWRKRRALFTGDTIMVTPNQRHAVFQWSFPNDVPLHPDAVRSIAARTGTLDFETLYAGFEGREIIADAKEIVARSAGRHCNPPRYD